MPVKNEKNKDKDPARNQNKENNAMTIENTDVTAVKTVSVVQETVQSNAKTESITVTVDKTNKNMPNNTNKANNTSNTKRSIKRTDQDQDKNKTNKYIEQ